MPKLSGRIAVVTGASAGIGMACAHSLAAEGASLVITARRYERLTALADELRSSHGTSVLPLEVDVRNRAAVELALGGLPEEWRRVDILVNNAGLSRGLHPLHAGEVEDWEEMIDTNVKGLLYVSRTLLPGMVERRSGTVVNIASIAGREAYPNGNVYCATKAAVKMLSEGMRRDVNGSGVRICNVDPGLVETEFSVVRFRGDVQRAESVYKGYQPLTAHDVADLVTFAVTRPPHVVLADTLLVASAQASATMVAKDL